MKKLMFAMVAAMFAIIASGAHSVAWLSGAMVTPGGNYYSDDINMYVFITDELFDVANVWNTYGNKLDEADGQDTSSGGDVSVQTNEHEGDIAYAAIIFTLQEGENDYYMVNAASASLDSAWPYVGELGTYIGGDWRKGSTEWKTVPEPTSGLLMLLGMAGLALKRKRA